MGGQLLSSTHKWMGMPTVHWAFYMCHLIPLIPKLYKFDYSYFVWLKKKSLRGFKQLFRKVILFRIYTEVCLTPQPLCYAKIFPMMMPWFLQTSKNTHNSKNIHKTSGSRCLHPSFGTAVESMTLGEEITTAGPLQVPNSTPCCPHTQVRWWQLTQAEGWVHPQGPDSLRSNTLVNFCWSDRPRGKGSSLEAIPRVTTPPHSACVFCLFKNLYCSANWPGLRLCLCCVLIISNTSATRVECWACARDNAVRCWSQAERGNMISGQQWMDLLQILGRFSVLRAGK